MPDHNKRTDVTVEKCVELYQKHKNKTMVADILDCSVSTIDNRLIEAEIQTVDNPDKYRRRYKKHLSKKERKVFDTRKEKAHYICTELAEPLAELILEVKGTKQKGGYARSYEGEEWGGR